MNCTLMTWQCKNIFLEKAKGLRSMWSKNNFETCEIAAGDPKEYKVGAILAMTGSGAWYGKVMSQGVLLAMDEINSKGGIDGVKLKLIVEEHESGKGPAAVSGFNKLVNIDKGGTGGRPFVNK